MVQNELSKSEAITADAPIRASFSINRTNREAIRWVAERYGVDQGDIVDIAPVLFTILAEQVLNGRRRRLDQLQTAVAQAARNVADVASLAPHLRPHAEDVRAALEQLLKVERVSIDAREVTGGIARAREKLEPELFGLEQYGDSDGYLHESRTNTPLTEALFEMVRHAGGIVRRDGLGEGGRPEHPHCAVLEFGSGDGERLAVRPSSFECFVTDRDVNALVSDPNSSFSRLGA